MARDLDIIKICSTYNVTRRQAEGIVAAVLQHLTAQAGASVVTVVSGSVEDVRISFVGDGDASSETLRAWIEGAMKG